MLYSKLGRTGIKVSKLCFGSLTLGPLQNDLPPEQAAEVLLEAFSSGVNFVDTAQLYRNYPHIRQALDRFSGEIVIASKTYAYTKGQAIDAVEEARFALARDVIDIFLLHEQESEHTLRGHAPAMEVLQSYKAKGVIRAVGISTHHVGGVRAAIAAGLDIVHPLINIAGLGILGGSLADMESAVVDARADGIGVYTMKALGGGNLFARAEEALRYALPLGDSLAIGMKDAEEVRANVGFLLNNRFTDRAKEYISTRKRKIFIENYCSACGKCIQACKHKALARQGIEVLCNPDRCVLCGYCGSYCENFCIKMI